jgi:transposase-like protein
VAQYLTQLHNPDLYRPHRCPQCQAKQPLAAHGFYTRSLIDSAFDGWIRVRRYLCEACRRTVSLLPEFALPYLRSSVTVIAVFLVARLLHGKTLKEALPTASPYQRGQSWVRRFRAEAEPLSATLSALIHPTPALNFVARALTMLNAAGWIPAHRFLFSGLRQHLLGWSGSLLPTGRRVTIPPAAAPA